MVIYVTLTVLSNVGIYLYSAITCELYYSLLMKFKSYNVCQIGKKNKQKKVQKYINPQKQICLDN